MSKRVRIMLGGILLTLMSVYFAIYVYSITLPKKGSSDGFSASWDGRGDPKIASVEPDGPSTGVLQVGDEMIAFDGVKIRENPGVLVGLEMPPGTRFTLTVRRAGELRDVSILTVPYKTRTQFDPLHYISLLFLLTGWIVFLLRPDDKQAWLLAIMLATLIGLVGNSPDNLLSWLALIAGVASVTSLVFFPVFVHFFLVFPDRSPLLRRLPSLETWIYLPLLLVILPAFGPGRLSSTALAWVLKIQWLQHLVFAALVLVIAYLAAGLVCLAINYRAASTISRRRLRVVMAGSTAGFLNLLLLIMGDPTGLQERMPTLWSWFEKCIYITLPLVPLSFVYAIVRHKVIPVSLIIRRGMRYLLVSRSSVFLEVVAVGVVLFLLMDKFFAWLRPTSGRVIGSISALVGIGAWMMFHWLHRKLIAPMIDRKFFRRAYDAQKIMADLADSLRSTASLPQLCEQVATKIQAALQTESVVVLLRDETTGDYQSNYSCEYQSGNGKVVSCQRLFRLSQRTDTVAKLGQEGQPVEVEYENNGTYLNGDAVLAEMRSSLLLPLMTKDGMPGIISLGPRLGDLPFSRDDKHLLMSVAGPATFAIENSRLVERMIEEARRREEIEAENEQRAKELEEARQLQISMLPKIIPQLPHLEIAAYMKTATEVGGDYYDFRLSASGELTIVVGDATGHGLKAGTVVTATKSLFNHLAETPDVTEFFSHSSLALKRMNMRSLFMAMTVARVKDHTLTVSSAGMPPVLIYRSATGEVEEVQLTGIPLGSMTSYRYRQQQLPLSSGDIVVLMSDGLPERFNPASEMFGYDQPKLLLAESAALSSQAIIERLVADAEVWAGGRPLDDDVTFVVLKVK